MENEIEFISIHTPRIRRTTAWTRQDIMTLIGECESRPCLWKSSLAEYKDRKLRMRNLQEMAEILNKDVNDINNKWQNLRCQFNAERKKSEMRKNGSSTSDVYVSKWEYFNSMKFLLPTFTTQHLLLVSPLESQAPRTSISSTENERCTTRKQKADDYDNDDDDDDHTKVKREKVSHTSLELMKRSISSDEIFGLYVADVLGKLKGKKKKDLRKKMEVLIANTSYDSESD